MSGLGQAARALTSLLVCGALLIVAAGSLQAQEPSAQAEPQGAEAAEVPAPSEAAEAPAEEEPSLEEPADEASEAVAAALASLTAFRKRELQAKLAAAQREEQETSLTLPWVAAAAGWGLVLTGIAIGVGGVLACDEDSCTGPAWPTWILMSGALVGTLGTVWLVLETRELAELRLRRQRIERMLEEDQWSQPAAAGPRAAFTIRGTF